ncbi:hypothetical protein TSAR_004866 [Trichomalopsis sarcophagae]|uniref:Cytochrome P450 n=1 Tax=Trichomalopsis sarcophagae TaxID=543379 RepID=A0A232EP07_9HYME|nr:hypothetical protein TSAR_004866 [Trichomalopsis sarcophagae]
MGVGILEILAGIGMLFLACYYYFTSTFNYWQSRRIPGPKPAPIYGNLKDIMFGKMSVGDFVKQEYDKFKDERMFGVYAIRTPVLIVNDPELIKDILIRNFSSFANRGVRLFEKVEPLSANLVNLEAKRWRPLRAKQITMFTFSKLKEMFYIVSECADNLEKILAGMIEKNDVVECCEVSARYTTDVIGACVFGIDMKALDDENSQFRRVGRKFIHADKWRAFKLRFKQIFPSLYNFLCPIMYDHEINDFFINTMIATMKHRKENNVRRGDFVDLLNDLKDNPGKLDGIELTDTLLTAQAFAFFFAGFDTSATTMSHALYELALNKSIQNKLREEIKEELAESNGKLMLESLKNMKYLDKVFNETLRKYPVTTILTRQAMESYTFNGTDLTIPKDTRVWIPVYGIHRDPKIYPDPDTFDPERFDEEKVQERHPSYYLPFGAGPRNCLGARFGNYQTKVGLITILKNYSVDICDQTPIPYVSNRRRFLLGPAAGILLKFTKLS